MEKLKDGMVYRNTNGEHFVRYKGEWIAINERNFPNSLQEHSVRELVMVVSEYAHRMDNNYAGEWRKEILNEMDRALS